MNEEKRAGEQTGMGYCPFSNSGRDTAGLYRDRQSLGAHGQGSGQAGVLGRTAAQARHGTTALRYGVVRARHGTQRARHGFVSRHDFGVATRGQRHGSTARDTTLRYGPTRSDTVLRHRAVTRRCAHATRPCARYDTVLCSQPRSSL